jgi:hypothetical protein
MMRRLAKSQRAAGVEGVRRAAAIGSALLLLSACSALPTGSSGQPRTSATAVPATASPIESTSSPQPKPTPTPARAATPSTAPAPPATTPAPSAQGQFVGALSFEPGCFLLGTPSGSYELYFGNSPYRGSIPDDLAQHPVQILDRAGKVVASAGDTIGVNGEARDGNPHGSYCLLEPELDVAEIVDVSPGGVVQLSDAFWARWQVPIGLDLPNDASSLADAVTNADLIIRGRITDLYVGEFWRGAPDEDPVPLAYASIGVDELFKGEPASRTPGRVEVQMGIAGSDLQSLRAALPEEEYLWFLKGPEGYVGRDLAPQNSAEIAPFAYVPFNDYQGVLRNLDGLVNVIARDVVAEACGPHHFPLLLDGTDFAAVVEQVRELTSPAPTNT